MTRLIISFVMAVAVTYLIFAWLTLQANPFLWPHALRQDAEIRP